MPFTLSDATVTVDFSTLEEITADEQANAALHPINVDVDEIQQFGRRGQIFSLSGELLSPFEDNRAQFRNWFRNQTLVTLVNDEWPAGIQVKIMSYQFHLPRGIEGILRVTMILREIRA